MMQQNLKKRLLPTSKENAPLYSGGAGMKNNKQKKT